LRGCLHARGAQLFEDPKALFRVFKWDKNLHISLFIQRIWSSIGRVVGIFQSKHVFCALLGTQRFMLLLKKTGAILYGTMARTPVACERLGHQTLYSAQERCGLGPYWSSTVPVGHVRTHSPTTINTEATHPEGHLSPVRTVLGILLHARSMGSTVVCKTRRWC
jgi:hypothetical protein